MTCGVGGHNPTLATLGVDTMRLYLQACEEKHGDWGMSAKLLGQIVQRKPDFAHAWAMLSAATASAADELPEDAAAPMLRQAAADARHALALDPTDGEAFPALADVQPGIARWPDRYAVLMRGHAIEPSNAVLNIELGYALLDVGRLKEGIPYAARSVELDPFNKWATGLMMRYLGYGGQADAIDTYRDQAHRLWPEDEEMTGLDFAIQAHSGDAALAEKWLETTVAPQFSGPRQAVWKAVIAARLSPTPAAIDKAVAVIGADAAAMTNGEALLGDAGMFATIGRGDLAFAALDRIGGLLGSTRPLFYDFMAPIRADPRFIAFAAKQGLVGVWRQTNHWPDFCSDPKLPYDCKKVAAEIRT